MEAAESVLDAAVREAADLRWFDLAALPDPVVPHAHQVMTALRDGTLRAIVTNGFPAL